MELGERDKENKDSFFDEEDNQKSRSQSEIVLIPPIAVIEDSTGNQEGNSDSHSEQVIGAQEPFHEDSQEPTVPLRRSTKEKKSAISDDFVIFLHEHEDGIWMMDDPLSVRQAFKSVDSDEWTDAMKEEYEIYVGQWRLGS